MFGVAHSLRAEYPSKLLLCLDVESTNSTGNLEAIDTALRHIASVSSLQENDSEFVERNGMYHVSKVVADAVLNQAQNEREEGEGRGGHLFARTSSTTTGSSFGGRVRPRTLDTLIYREIPDLPKLADEVEVNVHAAFHPKPHDGRGVGRFLGYVKDLVDERYDDLKTNHTDALQSFISSSSSRSQVESEALLAVFGGTDTTSTVLRDIIFYLSTTPRAYRALQLRLTVL
ncbi:hypothetical protein BDW71DRAFT_212141 [Aspergillus fruticulosus]